MVRHRPRRGAHPRRSTRAGRRNVPMVLGSRSPVARARARALGRGILLTTRFSGADEAWRWQDRQWSFAADMERPLSSLSKQVVAVCVPFASRHPLPLSSLGTAVGGEGGTLRRRVILISAGCAGAQSRMTVLRREEARSYGASLESEAPLSQSCDAHPPDRARLHPPTATPKVRVVSLELS
jgi:hypothetical protein